MDFVPEDGGEPTDDVPYFEDSHSDLGIEGHGTRSSVEELKAEIREAMAKMGGTVERIIPGKFSGENTRHGFVIEFNYKGAPGKVKVASLPIKKKETSKKVKQAKKQALYNIRNAFQAQYNLQLMSPGANPLLPYILADGTDRTASEVFEEQHGIPSPTKARQLEADNHE